MKITILLVMVAVMVFGSEIDPLSDEFIDYINSHQNTWTAGRIFDAKTTMKHIKRLYGAQDNKVVLKNINTVVHTEPAVIPESFDVREQWPECKEVVGTIADQSDCGSCWAVSTASAISDRRCIASKGKEQALISGADILSCRKGGHGCFGGYLDTALHAWYTVGVVTGGPYNSSQGCKPYPFQPCTQFPPGSLIPCDSLHDDAPPCFYECDDPSISYNDSLTFAESEPVSFTDVESIQREMLKNGTVLTYMDIYADFPYYKHGIYQNTTDLRVGRHAIRVIGWGVENDVPYWLIPNSWNDQWGENGYFRILRGANNSGIEQIAFAAQPKF